MRVVGVDALKLTQVQSCGVNRKISVPTVSQRYHFANVLH